MKHGRKVVVLVLAITFVALVLPLSIVHSKSSQILPFKEYATTQSAVGGTPPILDATAFGSGIATYLGKFTVSMNHFVNVVSLTFYGGTFTDTAANGDQVFGTYSGSLVSLANEDLEIHGIFTFTGGTGRFEGVVGGGSVTGIQHPNGSGWLLALGTISFQ